MARVQDRERAIQLRKLGYSYSQIKRDLDLSKSTLSDWLSNYPLTAKQLALLRNNSQISRELAVEKCRETKRLKRVARLNAIYNSQYKSLLPLTERELMIASLFLYWGEGTKMGSSVRLNNTDPKVVQFMLYWLIQIAGVSKNKIRVYVHLYRDMDCEAELRYWSKILKMPLDLFSKPYIKSSNRESLTHKGFGHGTCGLIVHNNDLKEQIMMGISAIADYYASKV